MSNNLTSINPATGQQIATYSIFDENKVQNAIETAQATFLNWSKTAFTERSLTLRAIAAVLRDNKKHLAVLATNEMGKPIAQGIAEIEKCADVLEYYADNGAAFLANEMVATEAARSYVAYRPMGIILAIMPWNFPYWQVFRAFAPAVMAGNVLLLKHASNVSGCALAIEEIINRAGGSGFLQTLLIPAARVSALIDHPLIAAVTLTGSTAAGRKVAEAAGRNLKKTVLELGGSDAYVVLEDADIEKAVAICMAGRLKNSGQSCIAAKRFVVVKSKFMDFETSFAEKMSKVTFGDPMNTNNAIGPMARHDLRDELHQQVMKSVDMGAKLLCGGYLPEMPGAYYPPTVLTNVKKGMPAYDEELFGPVAAIIEAADETDAMSIANDSIYGLGGCIISGNSSHAEKLAADEMQAGSCFVNEPVRSDQRLPFGGIKQSGYGRELGAHGIKEFVNVKTVYVAGK